MNCDRCQSQRVANLGAKCNDMCSYDLGNNKMHGNYYAPDDMGIGGGDYIEFSWCLDCGKLQGKFPLPATKIEKKIYDEEILNFYKNHFTEGENIYYNINDYNSIYYDIIASAEDIGEPFSNFIVKFFEQNNKRKPPLKYPPANLFLKMFRDGDASLPWEYVKKGYEL